MTTAVEITTRVNAPRAPVRAILSTASESASARSESGFALSMFSIQCCRTQLIDLPDRNCGPMIAPGGPYEGYDRRDVVVRQALSKRRHTIGPRIGGSPRREAAVQHHADRIDRRRHLDGLIAGQRRIARGLTGTFRPMTIGTLIGV